MYAFIVTYPYALNIFKSILTYYLLITLIYTYYLILTIVMVFLLVCMCSFVGFVGTLLFIPCLYTLVLLLNLNTFVFHSLKGFNIFNLCRFCPLIGLVQCT